MGSNPPKRIYIVNESFHFYQRALWSKITVYSPNSFSNVTVEGYGVDGSQFTVFKDMTKTQPQAAQYCSDNGLGQLAAVTYAHKQKQIRSV